MTDIVERLRSPDEANDENICQLLDDAADQIERLQATNHQLIENCTDWRQKARMLENLIRDFDTYEYHIPCECTMCDDLNRAARRIRRLKG